jgi:hypothetical protein
MNFTTEEEVTNKINFLDITILKNNNIFFDMYRKPTTTNTIISHDSCHHLEQKLAAIRYMKSGNETYILNANIKQKEYEIICHILRSNKYEFSIINKYKNKQTTKRKRK